MISLREEREALRRASAPVLTQIGRDAAGASIHHVRELLTYLVAELFSVELTVATWMAACRLSPENGSTLFQAHLGTPPDSYLWERRLETSAALLLETDFEPGQVALMVCFSTKKSFRRRFESWSGLTPGVFRREIRRLPGLFTESGESLLSRHLLKRLLDAQLSREEAGKMIAEMEARNGACWPSKPLLEPLERLFAREICENVVVSGGAEHEIALYDLCFKTPALQEHVIRIAKGTRGEGHEDEE